jgi:hypothetical protein
MPSFAPVSVGARGADRPGQCKTSTLVPDQRHQGLRNSLSLFCRARSPDGTSSVASTDVSDIAGKDHHIIVEVFYPALSVVRARVYTRLFDDCRAERAGLLDRSVERAHLEPEQNAETVARCAWIAKVGMPMNVPGVKLENHFAILDDLFVFIAAMTALAAKQLPVPMAAALHVTHGDQRLSLHGAKPRLSRDSEPTPAGDPNVAL